MLEFRRIHDLADTIPRLKEISALKQRRLIILTASVAVIFLLWSFFHQSEDDVIQQQEITGRITEIHQKRSPTGNQANINKPPAILIAVVEIDGPTTTEDGHARIMIRRDQFEVGDKIPLILKRYKDGSRKVILAPQREGVPTE